MRREGAAHVFPTEGWFPQNGEAVVSPDLAERTRMRWREVGFSFCSFHPVGGVSALNHAHLHRVHLPIAAPVSPHNVLRD